MNFAFLSTIHDPHDDRIFYHQARSLVAHGHSVVIITSRCDLEHESEGVSIKSFSGNKIRRKQRIGLFIDYLKNSHPDTIICSDPVSLKAAGEYNRRSLKQARLIYDITEWYPSLRIIKYYSHFTGVPVFIKRIISNCYNARLADSFIFGEWYKSIPFRYLYSQKPFIFLPYYPDLKYIPFSEPRIDTSHLRLSYSGRISLERGFGNIIEVINRLAFRRDGLKNNFKDHRLV